jgi:DNA-binding NtrC family response regulator
VRRALEREVAFLRSELARAHDLDEIVGRDPTIEKLHSLIVQVARTSTTVLITGESGTGKELVARAIHHQGPRRDGPFVAVNPAAIAETLIESELFGHERGAFTGAHQRKLGKFELAQGGTLFLDEIGTLRADLQAKLLRVIQEREIERVGGARPVKIDVRFIAATNTNLKEAIGRGAFRDDLYYRLNVVQVVVPPLRERIQDVPLLVDHFIRRDNRRFHKRVEGLSPEALAALKAYWWPGNVRELENVIERCVVLAEGPVIQLNDLPLDVSLPQQATKVRAAEALPLNEATDQFERQIVLRVLERVGWNLTEAGRILEVHRNSLRVKLARWGVRGPGGER